MKRTMRLKKLSLLKKIIVYQKSLYLQYPTPNQKQVKKERSKKNVKNKERKRKKNWKNWS